jgi:hypothetical protein
VEAEDLVAAVWAAKGWTVALLAVVAPPEEVQTQIPRRAATKSAARPWWSSGR